MAKRKNNTTTTTTKMQMAIMSLFSASSVTDDVNDRIISLTKERKDLIDQRGELELGDIDNTIETIADIFIAKGVKYSKINKFALDSCKLTKANWAFKPNGSAVACNTIKGWKSVEDEKLSKKYEQVSKTELCRALSTFEGMKGRKFGQDKDGYAILKRVKNKNGDMIANPLLKGKEVVAPSQSLVTEDGHEVGDEVTPSNPLAMVANTITQIEASFELEDSNIMLLLLKAQELLEIEMEKTEPVDPAMALIGK